MFKLFWIQVLDMIIDRELHWYMRLEHQGFFIFPSEERNPEYDRKFHYVGKMSGDDAYTEAYRIWPDIVPVPTMHRLKELEKTVAGTD